jgi:hypothetical protein
MTLMTRNHLSGVSPRRYLFHFRAPEETGQTGKYGVGAEDNHPKDLWMLLTRSAGRNLSLSDERNVTPDMQTFFTSNDFPGPLCLHTL